MNRHLALFVFQSINRIRLEFKDVYFSAYQLYEKVLIESDWNLKTEWYPNFSSVPQVLIESDWNLKLIVKYSLFLSLPVLIESDWNLK